MQSDEGQVRSTRLPFPAGLSDFTALQLDASLMCPGRRDSSCAHWDRTVQLFVCCDRLSPYCNTELGRWITAFRRSHVHLKTFMVLLTLGLTHLFSQQRDWTLADGCVPVASSAGRAEMYPDHEDSAVVHALDHLPQPEIQHRQSDEYLTGTSDDCHVTRLYRYNLRLVSQMMGRRCSAPSE